MRAGSVRIADVIEEGHRLTGGFHISEDEQAVATLRRAYGRVNRIGTLVHGNGVFSGPIFKGIFSDNPAVGEPYVSARDLVNARVFPTNFLSRKHGRLLEVLRIHEGMILVTCSGMNLGKAIWVRRDLDGLIASGDLIRIRPDATKVHPGYLFAFLVSRYGHALIRKQIYGGHIKHVDPAHIANLPLPRFGETLERKAHLLVEEAAALRVRANHLLDEAIRATLAAWSVDDLPVTVLNGPDVATPHASLLGETLRFDAFFYGGGGATSDQVLQEIEHRMPVQTLGELSEEVFETTRFGRNTVDDPAFGVPFLSISDLVRFDPRTDALVSKKQVQAVRADVRSGWLILPRVGQLQGVFGTVCYIPRHLDGVGVSDNNIRIVPKSEVDGAYLWAALSTKLLYRQIIRRACGTSIPYLDAKRVRQIPVPWPSAAAVRERIAEQVIEAMECRSAACEAEDKARAIVERAIEDAV